MIEVVGVGAGGHAKVVVEIVQVMDRYSIVGLLDADLKKKGTELLNIPILGDDSLLPDLYERGVRHAFVALGSVDIGSRRRNVYEMLTQLGFEVIGAVHSSAVISKSARLGKGVTVMAAAVINANSQIGNNVIINTAAVIEHDCVVGDHVHIATGACLAGNVNVGTGSHIGAGAVVLQGRTIGENSITGAGAVVVRDVPDDVVVMGVPARVYKRTSEVEG
jgi:UDP-perosamine 4-acetyltransferase